MNEKIKLIPLLLFASFFIGDNTAQAQLVESKFRLIAHRGGVVDSQLIEHSLTGLEEAIARGYWMVEVDIQETKDGLPIAHHDRDFSRYYQHAGKVADMTWEEIQQLRSTPGNHRPLLFREFAAACRDNIRVMIEVKGPSHSTEYYRRIEQILRDNQLLDTAYMIGISEAKDYFKNKLKTSLQKDGLQQALAAGHDVSENHFLFLGAYRMEEDTVHLARDAKLPIVAAINKHHYRGGNGLQQAQQDANRMLEMGITMFQIDSVYDPFFKP